MQFSLLELFKMGGVFMWPLLFFSIAAVAITLDRAVYIFSRNLKMDAAERRVISACENGDYLEAEQQLREMERAPFAAVLLLAIRERALPEKNLGELLENESMRAIDKLEAGFNYLVAIGSLAPLTGFLGTVSGMIGAFKSIAEATEVNAQIVANGIYEALITTVFGLVIAIIAMVSHSILTNIVDGSSARLSRTLTYLIIALKNTGAKNLPALEGPKNTGFAGEAL